MFIGKRSTVVLLDYFKFMLKIMLNALLAKAPTQKIEKEKRISFLICEACGAKSTPKR